MTPRVSRLLVIIVQCRSMGCRFSFSVRCCCQPRRGGISYERADKNAIYVRALGDSRLRGRSLKGELDQLFEWERSLIDKLSLPDCRMRFRSRFMSVQRIHRRRQSRLHRTQKNKENIDEYYYHPAQLLLTRAAHWDFDVFHLDTLTGGRSMLRLAYHIFREFSFIQIFHLDVIKLLRFFSSIEEHYHDSNPYHHVIHATDVTQAMFCYLHEDRLKKSVTPMEMMVAILSAMCHDLDHPGVNQTFLVATANHLATLYQNTSVLEMHHWRYGVGLMQESGLFAHFTNNQWASILWQFRSLILATDITRQQEFLLKFRRMVDDQQCDFETNVQTRHFVLQIGLKCADICNPCRKWELSEKWSRQVCDEFFRQGDLERQVGIPVTPLCDGRLNTVPKIQIGFMEVVVRPLFVEWDRFLKTDLTHKMLANLVANKQRWQDIEEKEAAARNAKPHTDTSDTPRKDLNSNSTPASTEEEISLLQDGLEDTLAGLSEEEGEEEDHGEEGDTVENDVNLAYHYQTDSEQLTEGGCYPLPPVYEEEQLRFLALNSRRRHSMPVIVRKDLGFYLGLRRDSCTCRTFLRRQSLPTTSVMPSWPEAKIQAQVPRDMSVDGLRSRPKISNLSSAMDPRLDNLTFLPLQLQTQRLQQSATDDHKTKRFAACHPLWQSSSCVEVRRRSHALSEDSERLRTVLSRIVTGARTRHQELVGLASSWPSVLRAGHRVDEDQLKLLASQVGLPSPDSSSDSDPSPCSSGSNSSDSVHVSRSPPPTVQFSRPH